MCSITSYISGGGDRVKSCGNTLLLAIGVKTDTISTGIAIAITVFAAAKQSFFGEIMTAPDPNKRLSDEEVERLLEAMNKREERQKANEEKKEGR